MARCEWVGKGPLEVEYHDEEWGVPVYDDRKLFEMLVLESAQSGLSWATILNKREGYRAAFDNFNAELIVQYSQEKMDELVLNPEIVRHKLKIAATVNNAKQFLLIQKEYGSFQAYIWSFVKGKPIVNNWKTAAEIPVKSSESDAMSKDLKKKGFKFLGSTTCYAYMQGVGMVNDHTQTCFRKQQAV